MTILCKGAMGLELACRKRLGVRCDTRIAAPSPALHTVTGGIGSRMGHLHGGQDVVLRELHLSRMLGTGEAHTVRVSEKRIVWYGEEVPCRNRDELPRRPSVSDSASPPWDLASCTLKWDFWRASVRLAAWDRAALMRGSQCGLLVPVSSKRDCRSIGLR